MALPKDGRQEETTWRRQLTQIVEAIASGLIVFNPDGRVVFANPEAARIVGLTPAAMVGRRITDPGWEVTTSDGKPFPRAQLLADVVKTGEGVHNIKLAVTHPDGVQVIITVNAVPLRDSAGKVEAVVASLSDITQLEQRASQYETMIKASMDGFWVSDTEGRLLEVNDALSSSLGYSRDELLNMTIADIEASETPEDVAEHIKKVLKTGHDRFESKHRRKDGRIIDIEVSAQYLAVEGGRFFVFTQDITERKEAERLGEAMNEINALVGSTLDFNEMMERLTVVGARTLGADACRVALLDDDHWVLRFTSGLPAKAKGRAFRRAQMPAANLAYETGVPVAVDDVHDDPRVNPKVMEEYGVRSLLAVALTIRDEPLGVVFFDYRNPIEFRQAHIDFAAKLAASVSLALKNARLFEAERRIALTLQESLLTVPENVPGIDIGDIYRSATIEEAEVGGDFYDVFELEHDRVGIVIGDVSGKGVEAATLTALVKNTIRAYAYQNFVPASVITMTNNAVIKRTAAARTFVTVFFGVLNTSSGVLRYCAAGHPPPILKTAGGAWPLENHSPAIGVMTDLKFVEQGKVLYRGMTLVLYTDGVTEARRKREFFGEERLINLIADLKPVRAKKIAEKIFKEVMAFSDGNLADDTALLVLSLSSAPKID